MSVSERRVMTGYIMVMTSSLLFGFNGNLSRLLLDDGVTPLTLVEFRMLIGGLCLMAVLLFSNRRERLRVPRRTWGWIVAFGLSLALVAYTYFVAISRLPLAVALVIQFSAGVWMALGSALWLRRFPSSYVSVALLLTCGGVTLLTGIWRLNLYGMDVVGLFYAFLSLVTMIVYLLLGRKLGPQISPVSTTAYGALVATLFWFCVQPPWSIPPTTWTSKHLLLILLVGVLGMAIPFALVQGALQRVDATRIGIMTMLELVAAGVIAYFWLGQHLDLWQIVGCLLVMGGMVVLQMERPRVAEGLPEEHSSTPLPEQESGREEIVS